MSCITDGVWRGSKLLNLKSIVDVALEICSKRDHKLSHCFIVKHLLPKGHNVQQNGDYVDYPEEKPAQRPTRSLKINWTDGRDIWWHDVMGTASTDCEPEWMDAEDPLFMLYTRFRCKTRAVTIASLHASAHTGDSGYALKPWMLVPFMNPSTPAEEEFNRRHCRTRVTIEQLFGIVKSRFRCIHKTGGCLCYVPAKCCRIIAAVFILHNICVDNKIPCLENDNVPDEYNDLNPPLNEGVVCGNGQQIRRNLAAQFV
ncbi:ACSS1_2 [Mytilus edulis]|uniref:ACSS1_2 n=1 Tax=Mytilus edulis TaxID=6550 RepID=A0A8S3PVP2_MYTED|nr:ACSS1_2 [Mytilus edulis]